MFLGNGEKAGSGADIIKKGWEDNKWPQPILSERVQPDETEMTLGIEGAQENGLKDDPKTEKWPEKAVQILRIIKEDKNTTIPQLEETLHLGHTTLKKILKEMQNENFIRRIGPANGGRGHWEVVITSDVE